MTEFELIANYFSKQQFSAQQASTADGLLSATETSIEIKKGIGDDAAVVAVNQPTQWVTCVDTLVQGRHFDGAWQQVEALAFAIGFKSVVVNVSDLAAMGATPHSLLLALALPQRLATASWLTAFAKGLFHACQHYGLRLIGGDTTRSDNLVISITANGWLDNSSSPVYRSGAKVGDKVYVSGTIGDAGYALQHLDDEVGQQLAHRLHLPVPRVSLGQSLVQQGRVTAMMDVSDGLVQDLGHICQQSGVAMRLHLEHLPTSQPLQTVCLAQRLPCQLSGGDDYELVFTLPAHIEPPETTTPVTYIADVIENSELPKQSSSGAIQLSYQNRDLSVQNPYPFDAFPVLAGFQHFSL